MSLLDISDKVKKFLMAKIQQTQPLRAKIAQPIGQAYNQLKQSPYGQFGQQVQQAARTPVNVATGIGKGLFQSMVYNPQAKQLFPQSILRVQPQTLQAYKGLQTTRFKNLPQEQQKAITGEAYTIGASTITPLSLLKKPQILSNKSLMNAYDMFVNKLKAVEGDITKKYTPEGVQLAINKLSVQSPTFKNNFLNEAVKVARYIRMVESGAVTNAPAVGLGVTKIKGKPQATKGAQGGAGKVKVAEQGLLKEAPKAKLTGNIDSRISVASQQVEQDLSQMSQTLPTTAKVVSPKTQPSGKVQSSEPIIADTFNINPDNLRLDKQQQATLAKSIGTIKPALEEIKGKTLSNSEVVKAAKSSEILSKVVSRADTLAAEAQILKARQQMVSLDKEIDNLAKTGNVKAVQKRMEDLINSIKTVSGTAADTGRKLQSFSIGAKDESLRQQLLKEVLKTTEDTNRVVAEASKVDWTNSKNIVDFYRKFVKPSITDVLTEYRYNNMLSNPRTHLRNAISNVIQTFITKPATILAQGKVKGTVQYYKGAISSLPKATDAFMTSFRGAMTPSAKYEVTKMSTGKLPRFFTIPSRAMEAADKFFSTLITSGEMARGVEAGAAKKTAEYSLFRSELFPEGQGPLLNAIDTFTNGLYKLRKVPGGDWFVPFLRTPMNVAKQWVEYSPAGLGTIPGAANKGEQLAKTLIGSVATAVGAQFAFEGLTTWATPTDPKQKQYFYDTGRKPFSVNIKGNWVPMATFGVFAFPLALPAAVKYFRDESRTAMTDSDIDKITKIIPGLLNFWSSQTPLSGLGGFVRTLQGDIDYSVAKNLGFTASQIIPFQALVRYLTTAIDPVYRKASGPIEQIQSSLPFASMKLPPYTDSSGVLSKRNISDYVAPYSIGKENPQYEDLYQMRGEKLQMNAVKNKMEKEMENKLNQATGLEVGAAETPAGTGQSYIDKERAKMQADLAKEKFKMSDETTTTIGTDLLYKEGDSIKTIDLSFEPTPPVLTGSTELDKKAVSAFNGDITKKSNDINKLYELKQLSQTEAEQALQALADLKIKATPKATVKKAKKGAKVTIKKLTPAKIKVGKSFKRTTKITPIKKATIVKPRVSRVKYKL